MSEIAIHPVTPALAEHLGDLMDSVAPAGRCSCMYWRVGSTYRDRPPEDNRADFLSIVDAGPPPGLLAIRDDVAAGWCQITPRSVLPTLQASAFGVVTDDGDLWSISCFVIRTGHRRNGMATVLTQAAIDYARDHGATAVEAYPLDAEASPSSTFTGYVSTFERLGFTAVARPSKSRVVMRKDLATQPDDPTDRTSAG